MLSEEMRPKTLKDFIGNKTAITQLDIFLSDGMSVLLTGPPGCGKTTLAHCYAVDNGFIPFEVNASQERKKSHLSDLIKSLESHTLYNKPKLLIVDECEGATKEYLTTLAQLKQPKIFICNKIKDLPKAMLDKVMKIPIFTPTIGNYKKLLSRLGHDEVENDILESFLSWRDLYNWLDGGDFRLPDQTLSEKDLVILYLRQGGDHMIASYLDQLLHGNKIEKKVARDILGLARTGRINF